MKTIRLVDAFLLVIFVAIILSAWQGFLQTTGDPIFRTDALGRWSSRRRSYFVQLSFLLGMMVGFAGFLQPIPSQKLTSRLIYSLVASLIFVIASTSLSYLACTYFNRSGAAGITPAPSTFLIGLALSYLFASFVGRQRQITWVGSPLIGVAIDYLWWLATWILVSGLIAVSAFLVSFWVE